MKEKLFFGLFTLGLIGFVTFSAHQAYSFPGGINDHSGMDGNSCNSCHSGGQSPDVTIEGPELLFADRSATYTLIISGGQAEKFPSTAAGGLNVAVSEGVLDILANATDVYVLDGEITHSAPKPIDEAGEVRFSFQYTAPMTPTTTITMFGAGNSVNGMDGFNGDAASLDELAISVQEAGGTVYMPFVIGSAAE